MSRESKGWNEFLAGLWRKLSTYEIQKDKEKYVVAEIEYWGESGHEQRIKITNNNFVSFINETVDIMRREYVKNTTITESQLAELNHILSLTLKVGVNKSCSGSNEFVIKGDYVKFSDFVKEDGSLGMSNECNDTTAVKVFALNTLFVDRDVKLIDKTINMIVVSPKWEIIGTRSVELSGLDWLPADESNNFLAMNRPPGDPGFQGRNGANFLGIGAEFVNGKNFTIISIGGKGQHGISGSDGKDGIDGTLNLLLDNQFVCEPMWCDNGLFPTKIGNTYRCDDGMYIKFSSGHVLCYYTVFGTPGTPGENGGPGGKGGRGGYPGNIELFELNGSSGISRYIKLGKSGKHGVGGRGGRPGVNGTILMVFYTSGRGWKTHQEKTPDRGPRAKNGVDGGVARLELPATVVLPKSIEILKEYKNYLRDNLKDHSKRYALLEFFLQLDNNDSLKRLYDTRELFNELKDMEEQFQTFNDNDDLDPIYQSLLNRIKEYALNPREIENSNEYKVVLMNLYTATLGKITLLVERSKSNLIIDIDAYIELIMEDIKNFKDLQVASDKINLINNYKKNYKKNIDQQIEEAKYAIQRQIIPEIVNVHASIDEQIDKLIGETQALEYQAENERKHLVAKRDELKKAINSKLLLSALSFVGQVVGFFSPIGSYITSWVGSIKAWSDFSDIDNRIDHGQNLRSDVQRYATHLENDRIKKINKFNELLNDMARKRNVHPEKFEGLAPMIDELIKRLSNHSPITYFQVQKMEDELGDQLKKVRGDLTGPTKEERGTGKLDENKTVKKAVTLYKLGHDIYDKYKDDEDKVNAIIAAIEQKNEKIEELEEYEKNIHDAMIPMWQNVEDQLRDIANDLDDKSQVYLNVTRWHVQSFLKDVKNKVTKMTENFKDTNDKLSYCVDMLEDTMTTLINVYDKIQDYQSEQKLVEFFANVSLIAGSNVKITDPRISNIVDENALEKLIRSNYVMMRLKTGIEAFKSFIFPMAHVYLKNTVLPSQFLLSNNFDEFLTKSAQQMVHVKSTVDTYKTYLNGAGYNPNIKLAPFKSEYTSTRPFFTWKNSQHKEMISKLLSGQRITVTADIEDSPLYKDAIKFSVAEFFFNARNETMQSEINNVLKGFEVEAWHRGDSHYRCNNKIYRLNSNVTSISYYFEKGADGEPISKSLTYVKLEKSESILSPYATWEVILMETGYRYTFRDLDKYKDFVDLELMGYGSYIDNRRVDYSKLMVDNYYQPIKTYKGLNSKHQTSEGTSSNRHVRSAHWPNDLSETSDESPKSLTPITNEGNFFNTTMSTIKNLRAIKSITNWYGGKAIKIDEEISAELYSPNDYHDSFESASIRVDKEIADKSDSPNDVRDFFELNTNPTRNILPGDKVEWSSDRFIDNDNHSISDVDYNSLHNQANLVLLDLAIRTTDRTKHKNVKKARRYDAVTEDAQYLAYSAYAPGNRSLNNTTHSFAP